VAEFGTIESQTIMIPKSLLTIETSVEGGIIKESGVKILHKHEKRIPVDLARAWVKSGVSRKSPGRKNPVESKNEWVAKNAFLKTNFLEKISSERGVKAILIDHCAERSLEMMEGAGLAVTIGDDTTEIAGSIFSRFGIPVLGVMDGDCDELARSVAYSAGSLVLNL